MTITDSGMPYKADRRLFLTVMSARKLYQQGMVPGLATYKVAKNYPSCIEHYTGKIGDRNATPLAALVKKEQI